MMSRSIVPSRVQVDILLECLEERRWLGTGHARTSHARDRVRAAWEEVATKLNSDGSGCIKSWQQWSKYWKDKKSAVRKKASQNRMARQQTGGGALEERLVLSAVEERIIALMGGEGFVTGDRELEIDLIHPSTNEPRPIDVNPDGPSSNPLLLNIQDVTDSLTPGSESILQGHVQLFHGEHSPIGMLQTTPPIPVVQPGPSRNNVPREDQPSTEQMFEAISPPALPHRSRTPFAASSPRRRRLTAVRRRLNQRTPPSQRQSQLASLTERFIAIEEKRLDNERLVIDNQQKMLDVFQAMSEAWTRQAQAMSEAWSRHWACLDHASMQDLCSTFRRGT